LRWGRANQLEIDIVVILLFTVPRKYHLIPVGRKAWRALRTGISGEREHFRRRVRLSVTSAKKPHANGHR
jgi:hypothetical protein